MPAAKRTKKAAAPAVEAVEEDFDIELDADEEVEEAPKAKKSTKKAAAEKPAKAPVEKIEFGSAWLAEHVNAEAGTSYDAYNLRILLRKLRKEGTLVHDGEGRARYSFTGAEDPQVVAIVEAVKSGAAEKAKAERLDELKEKRKTTKKTSKKAAAQAEAAEPEAEEEDDFEDIEDDI